MELNGRYNICAVSTQGKHESSEFVSEYYVLSSEDGQTWTTYQSDNGQDQVQRCAGLLIAFFFMLDFVFGYSLVNLFSVGIRRFDFTS